MISRITLLLTAIFALMPLMAQAQNLSPRAEVNFRAGTDRSILMTELWAPLVQQRDHVLYADLRLMGDGDDNREGNLGFGYRQIVPRFNSVFGANAWIDRRRTENGNHFHQLTLGIESLGDKIDVRANGYIQLNNSKVTLIPSGASSAPYLAGTGIFVNTNGFIIEEPQDGFDAEIGYRIPALQKHIDATRIYAGGYHFWGDQTDNVTGFRLRTEAQVNSIFSVGARFQHDGPRGSQGFLEATLRFPFSAKKLYQEHGLKSRLDESPERDIDIVTGKVEQSGKAQAVINTQSGEAQRVLYVDNTASTDGNGTKEDPFNTLAAAQTALRDNDILYINHGDGTTTGMNQGLIVTKNNIQIIGSGSDFIFDNNRFTTRRHFQAPTNGTVIIAESQSPIITNTQSYLDDATGNGLLITGSNPWVSGITVRGASFAGIKIYADGHQNTNINIHDVVTDANNSHGIAIISKNGTTINHAYFTGITSSNNLTLPTNFSARGVQFDMYSGTTVNSLIFENNIFDGNGLNDAFGAGIGITLNDSSLVKNTLITNNIIQNHSGVGGRSVTIATNTNSKFNQIDFNYNSGQNENSGFTFGGAADLINIERNMIGTAFYLSSVLATAGNTISDINIRSNSSGSPSANARIGIDARGDGNSIGRILRANIVDNDTGIGNGEGVSITTSNGSTVENVLIQNNLIRNRTGGSGNGIILSAGTNSIISGITISDNYISNVLHNGIYLFGNVGTVKDVNIHHNFIDASSRRGIYAYANGGNINSLTIENNSITNSIGTDGHGITLQTNLAGSRISSTTIQNNTVTGNSQRGIYLVAANATEIAGTLINNNTITGNASQGIIFQTSGVGAVLTSTIISNNTVNNNGSSGIYFVGGASTVLSEVSLQNNTTNNNATNGIHVYANGGLLSGISITQHTSNTNTQRGIYLQSAGTGEFRNLIIAQSSILNNAYDGLSIISAGSGNIEAKIERTTITGNGTGTTYYGVRIDHDSTGSLNIDMGGGSLASAGQNRIHSSVYREVYIDSRPGTVAATIGSIIAAQNNWWGVSTGLDQATRATFDNGSAGVNGSRIDASSHLTAAPGI